MRITLLLIVVLIVTLSFSVINQASSKELKAPSMFDNGPAVITAIKLEADEVVSLVLLESVISLARLAVLADGCQAVEGNYSIELTADGARNKPETNVAKIISSENSELIVLNATIEEPDSYLGQNIKIHQSKKSKLKETLFSEYTSVAIINRELTLLSMQSNANIFGQNKALIPYQNLLIKHFYLEQKPGKKKQYIMGWGEASLSKAGFPSNQFWVRFKALKANGGLKRVVFQEDQLVGPSACRIVIDSTVDIKKENKKEMQKIFVLKGVMIIRSQSYKKDATPLLNGF